MVNMGIGLGGLLIDRLPALAISLQLLLAMFGLTLQFRARRYYKERIGVVEPRPHLDALNQLSIFSPRGMAPVLPATDMCPYRTRGVKILIAILVGSPLVAVPFVSAKPLFALCADTNMAALSFWTWWDSREHRADQARYVIAAAFLLVFGWQSFASGLFASSMACIHLSIFLVGLTLFVCGLLDHRDLMNAFDRPPGTPVENHG